MRAGAGDQGGEGGSENVREANFKQVSKNKEINEIVNIIGLKYKKKYERDEDMRPCATGRPGQSQHSQQIEFLAFLKWYFHVPSPRPALDPEAAVRQLH